MKTIIPFLLLASCGGPFCENPDFVVAGLKICTDGNSVDPAEVEIIAKTVEQKVREVYSQVPTNTFEDYKRNNIRIQFIDDSLERDCTKLKDGVFQCKKPIGGTMTKGFNIYRIYIRYHKCLITTSLDHELLHVLEYFYLGGPQGEDDHSTPFMYQQDFKEQGISFQDTIESKIYDAAKPHLQSCQMTIQ